MDKRRMNDNAEFDTAVRLHVYQHIIDTGEPPGAAETATALNRSNREALGAYQRLHHEHVLVLAPDATTIRMAMPFSAIPTSYRVTVDDRSWWAN